MSTSTDNWKQVEADCKAALSEPIVQFIAECRKNPHSDSRLIAVLHEVQGEFGFISATHIDAVAQLMQIPAAKVAGAASFYHFFRLSARGKYMINICMGTACYVKGAEKLAHKIMDELGITWGETSSDGVFTLEGSRCLGTCGLAPVVMVNDQIHGQMTPDKIPALLEEYLRMAHQEEDAS